jgi:integrase/recombinase XerD
VTELALAGVARDLAQNRLGGVLAALWAALESPETRRAYREDWTRFSAFLVATGKHPLTAGPVEVGQYLEHLRARGLARSTRSRALSVLRQVFAAVYRSGLRVDNPSREFQLPRVDRAPRTPWLSEDPLVALLRPWGDSWESRRDRLVLLMLFGLALRRSSVAGARVDDLRRRPDGRLGLHVRGKGGKEADLLMPEWLAAEIENWIAFSGVTGPLFPRLRRVGYDDLRPEMNRAIGPSKVWEIVGVAGERAGIEKGRATPHALRRSFVTIARSRGVPLDELQAALMHSQITTTEGYDKAARTMKSAPGDALADIYEAANVQKDGSR